MEYAANSLHLAGHRVSAVTIFSAGDVEVHRADGKYYLIDLARAFPPESVLAVADVTGQDYPPSSIFHRMIRPEALIIWKNTSQGENRPLSPDALTNWGSFDLKEKEKHNQTVYDVTNFVLTTQVEKLATHLLTTIRDHQETSSNREQESNPHFNLAAVFHENGVNMRHIGLVSEQCQSLIMRSMSQDEKETGLGLWSPAILLTLCSEILFRTLKNTVKRFLRNASKATNSELKKMLAWFVNISMKELSYGLHSLEELKFLKGQITSSYGAAAYRFVHKYADLWKSQVGIILVRVFKRCGIEVEKETELALSNPTKSSLVQKLSPLEFLSFSSSVKKMVAFDVAICSELIRLADSSNNENSHRWRKISLKHLNECLSHFPNDKRIKAMIAEQMTLLFNPSKNMEELLSFEEQKQVWLNVFHNLKKASTPQLIKCGSLIRNSSHFFAIQCLLFLEELEREPSKDKFELMPNFLGVSEFVFPEDESQVDSSMFELLLLVQLVRTRYNFLKKRKIFPGKYDSKKVLQRYGTLSPQAALLFAINHNTHEGFDKLDMRVQVEIVSRLRDCIRDVSLSNVSLRYLPHLFNLSPKLACVVMLLPQDFSCLLDSSDAEIKVLKLPCSSLLQAVMDNREFFTKERIRINDDWQKKIHFATFVEDGQVTLLIFLTGEASEKYHDSRDVKVFVNSKQYTPKPVGTLAPIVLPNLPIAKALSGKEEDVKLSVSWTLTGDEMAYTIVYFGCLLHGTVIREVKLEKEEASRDIFSKGGLKNLFALTEKDAGSGKRKSKLSKSPLKRLSFFEDAKTKIKDSAEASKSLAFLGSSHSGKTSILRHFVPYTEDDIKLFVPIIRSNILQAIRALLTINISLRDDRVFRMASVAEQDADKLEEYFNKEPEPILTRDLAEQIDNIWKDPGFRITFEKNPPQHLSSETAAAFFDNVRRIAEEDFRPTLEEIANAYFRTTDICRWKSKQFTGIEFIDVGGRLVDRLQKWVKVYNGVTAILYVVSIGDYDKNFEEDSRIKTLKGELSVFAETYEINPELKQIPLILVFNKKDLFKNSLGKIPLSSCFEDWKEGSVEEAQTFISKKFLAVLPGKTDVYIYFTEATRKDSNSMKPLLEELPGILDSSMIQAQQNLTSGSSVESTSAMVSPASLAPRDSRGR
eukprot:TRINITY_DN55998_c0_g1_i1.p1 TRINITY_DN55998_c0_g1~~TRINITY_DN55998_c0_g1_i1.p1  ORF type:complete len:1319 (+),score=314.27 TRINITY_DN55998_c0_g1_i1:490-3957(+)